MTIEIRELIVKVEVTEHATSASTLPFAQNSEWDQQRLVEIIKQAVLEQLLERGHQ